MAETEPSTLSSAVNPFAWGPTDYLTPAEIDDLRRDKRESVRLMQALVAKRRASQDEAAGASRQRRKSQRRHEESIGVFEREVVAFHRRKNWSASASLARLALRNGFRSGFLYLLGSHALGNARFYGEARDLLLQGEDLLIDDGTFHYNLACYECRLGNLEEAEERLKKAILLDATVPKDAMDDPDLEGLWETLCKKWGA